jgi:DNA-binding CsgD family transcriptional regulator
VVFLIDHDGGTALTLTMWDSEDAASATDRFAEQSRASTVAALATRLRHPDASAPAMPRLRVRARSGRWAILHASWMTSHAGEQAISVILEEAAPAEIAPMIMAAYGLTERERTICGLVCQGMSTRQIADQLHLTTDTVQDHLKSVFGRTGVHSRGELVATILQRDYLPRMIAGDPLGRSGAFAADGAIG